MNIQEKLSIIYFALIPIFFLSLVGINPILQTIILIILLASVDVYTEKLNSRREKKRYFTFSLLFLLFEFYAYYLLVFAEKKVDDIGYIIMMFLFSLILVPLLMLMNSNVYKKYIVKKTERTDVKA